MEKKADRRRFSPAKNPSGKETGFDRSSKGPDPLDSADLKVSIDAHMRGIASFFVRNAAEIVRQRQAIEFGELDIVDCRDLLPIARHEESGSLPKETGTIGESFEIHHGMEELRFHEGIGGGKASVYSIAENCQGTHGWLKFSKVLSPYFVSVARHGPVGKAQVQLEPCAVDKNFLVLLPKEEGFPDLATLVLAAVTLHSERWRFESGQDLAPSEIARLRMPESGVLRDWAADRIEAMLDLIRESLELYVDSQDEFEQANQSNIPNGHVPIGGLDPREHLRRVIQVHQDAAESRKKRLQQQRLEDEIDAEDSRKALEEPRMLPFSVALEELRAN